jgi:tripartite ATP-independent transporter DctM subunit
MNPTITGILGLVALFVLLALRMPVGIAMMIVGAVGIAILNGIPAALGTLGAEPFVLASNFELLIIPLFIFMGNLAGISGMSRDLYAAAYAWIGHWRGGLASATIAACAGFAALSGSSVASAVTMGRVSLPEMKRFNYSSRLATGCIAAGGTLGILIPPSTGFIIYAILTEESIGRLFLAGMIPGILLASLFIAAIAIMTRINAKLGPPGPRHSWKQRGKATGRAMAMILIVVITIGGIYGGIFTTGEAAGVGAFLAFCLTAFRRQLGGGLLNNALLQTVRTTAFAFLILIGAHIFNPFLALTQIPTDLAGLLTSTNLPPIGILAIILFAFIILGTFLEGFAILVLTLPIVHPLIVQLGYDPIWFGVLMVVVLEMGLISPPVGINVFVVKAIADDVPMSEIFIGILPFWLAMFVCMILLIIFPQIALFLPNTMIN